MTPPRAGQGIMPPAIRDPTRRSTVNSTPGSTYSPKELTRQGATLLEPDVKGDLVIAGDNPRRIFLLTSDGKNGVVPAMLASNAVEYATDFDVIVRGCAPYALVIQPEMYGRLRPSQLLRTVGEVPVGVVNALRLSLTTDGESVESYERGLPLGGVDDPRRRFKESELADLYAICHPSMNPMLNATDTRSYDDWFNAT